MIRSILIINTHGKPRLLRFYNNYTLLEQQAIISELYTIISKRNDNVCNFIEGASTSLGSEYNIIYRHYATLYIIFIVDNNESELGILDLIQIFVETLDISYNNICELDIIFNSEKVNYILDEIIMSGMVVETNLKEITSAVAAMNKFEADSESSAFKNSGGNTISANSGYKK